MSSTNNLILYHYNSSPYGQRIVYYLTLRGIPYAECRQPFMLPRPDLELLNISYRRIPLLAIDSSIYIDTRHILPALDALHPPSSTPNAILEPVPDNPETSAITALIASTVMSGEIFARASQLIPASSPAMQNAKFLADRAALTGRSWDKETAARGRPEAIVVVRNYFAQLEHGLLADGRKWVLNTRGPTMADIEAVWVPAWLVGMKDALPEDVISEKLFPKVFAYTKRFLGLVAETAKKNAKPERLNGSEAAKRVLQAKPRDGGNVERTDPLGLKKGQDVTVWPIDSGFSHKDQGTLVGLTWNEVVIDKQVDSQAGKGAIRLHFPRTGFRIAPAKPSKL